MTWALVLGATSGTGLASSRALLLDPGLHVAGVHRGNHLDGAAELADAADAAGRRYLDLQGDGSKPEAIDALCARLRDEAGPHSVSFVLHSIASASVGTLIAGPGPHLQPYQLQKTFDRMAHSLPWWVQALDRHELLAPGAHVLGLTNPVGDSLIRGTVAITASKAALELYMKHLAFELGPRGMRCNLLNFSMVETPATEATFDDSFAAIRRVVRRVTPAGRLVPLSDVAEFVSLLAGPRLSWFNGAVIDYTGGEMLAHYDALVHEDPIR